MKRSAHPPLDPRAGRRARLGGFTLIELLVVIGIIALLMSILLPVFRKVRDAATTTQCLSNLRQIGFAITRYADDHRGSLVPGDYVGLIDGAASPGAGSWADILVDGRYLSGTTGAYPADKLYADIPDGMERAASVLHCQAGDDQNAVDNYPTTQTDPRGGFYFVRGSDTTHQAVFTWYAVNCRPRLEGETLNATERRPLPFSFLPDYGSGVADWSLTRISRLKATTPLIFDGVWCFNGDPARINARHRGNRATNILFGDGHCDTQPTASLPNDDWYLR